MVDKSTSSGTSSQTNTPAQIGYLNTGFADAQTALGTAQRAMAGSKPDGFTASMTPQQLAAYQSVYGSANGNGTGGTQQGAGNTASTAGAGGVTGALSGYANFNPNMQGLIDAGNKYAAGQDIPGQVKAAMFDANQNARDVTLPGIDANAAGTGNTNSSRTGVADGMVQRGLAEQAGSLSSTLRANAFNTGAGLGGDLNNQRIAALGGQASAGTGALNAGSGAASGGVLSQANIDNQLLNGAGGAQQNQQDIFNNQNQAFNFGQTAPFTALQQYMNALNVNAGGTSSGTTTQTPSFMQTVGSLLGGAGSLIGKAGGVGGAGASGLLAFSDRRLKTDIVQIGVMFDGVPIYRFRYTADPSGRTYVGLMAQDVEEFAPEAVQTVAGFKAVDYAKATERAAAHAGGH